MELPGPACADVGPLVRQLLVDLSVASVVDMSPGSGALACACMSSKGQSNDFRRHFSF